jgi:hypothetical protein
MKKMKAVAGEIIITTETATEIKEGQKSLSFLPSFFPSSFFINSVQYAPFRSEILSSTPLLKTFI